MSAPPDVAAAPDGPTLTPGQKALVHLPSEGQFLVRGAAGSGKTTVALARAMHLARQPLLHGAARVLLVARAPSAAAALSRRRNALASDLAGQLDVDTVPHWCRRFLASGPELAIASDTPLLRQSEFERLVATALQLVRRTSRRTVLRRPLAFFTTELQTMLLGLGIETFEDYRPVARQGRASGLDHGSRRAVFALFTEVHSLAEQLGRRLPLALAPPALRQLAGTRPPPFNHVVVDDAHLLAPIELKLVRALATGGSLTLFAALEQRFEPLASNLTELGLGRLDRTDVLPTGLRSPTPIYKTALAILKRRGGAPAADSSMILPGSIDGPRPRLLLAKDWRGELAALIDELTRLRADGRPLRDIAVIGAGDADLELVGVVLARAGIAAKLLSDDDAGSNGVESGINQADDRVTLCSLAVAQGREFPIVHLLDVNRGAFPRLKGDLAMHERADAERSAARALHLALTRATEQVTLFASEATLSPLVPKKWCTIVRV